MDRTLKRPPLGVMPKWLWVEKRVKDLAHAINRRLQESWDVPVEWVDEYNSLVKEENKLQRLRPKKVK